MRRLVDSFAAGVRRVLRALDRPARSPLRERPPGVALIVALVTITVLSAAVTEYAYSSRVNLKMSVNAKNKVKSYFLARSAVNLSELLINFQYSLENAANQARGSKSANAGACNPGMISVAMRRSNFQIYQYMDVLLRPFNSGSLETPVGGLDLKRSGVKGFEGVHGTFDVNIEPESGKLNINRFADGQIKQDDLKQFCALVTDSQYTDTFRQGEKDAEELDAYRVLRYIVDYIDLDDTELPLTRECTLEDGGGSSESSRYDDAELDIEPRNAKLTHPAELYQVYGVSEAFMRAFGEELTVYPVGKPNANMADFPVFFSVLCRNTRLGNNANVGSGAEGFTVCQKSPKIALQVMYFAMALDGVRQFFEDPISVLMAYVGSTQSRLLPSAKKGQPVAFLRSSQVHSYLEDFRKNPQLMAQFMQFSPAYRKLAQRSRDFAVSRQAPNFPNWAITFDRTGIIRAVSTQTPSIYRVTATGTYGSTETSIETVIDFDKTIRELPGEDAIEQQGGGSERVKQLKKALKERRKTIPKGRVLFWRQGLVGDGQDEDDSPTSQPVPGEQPAEGEGGGEGAGEGTSPEQEATAPGGEQPSAPGGQNDDWDFEFDD